MNTFLERVEQPDHHAHLALAQAGRGGCSRAPRDAVAHIGIVVILKKLTWLNKLKLVTNLK